MPNEILRTAKDALDKALAQKKITEEMVRGLSPAIIETLQPILNRIADNAKLSKEEILFALSNLKIDVPKADVPQAQVDVKIPEIKVPAPQVTVNVPEIKVPVIASPKIPTIKVPKPEVTVNVPAFPKLPDLKWPEEEMPIKGWVQLMGVDLSNPLPVQLRDKDGKPVSLVENLTQIISAGGAAHQVKVSDIRSSTTSVIDQVENAVRTLAVGGSAGLTDTELRASAVPVSQVSGAIWSVSVNDSFRTTVASNLINSDDRLRVSLETGGAGLTDSELRASSVPVAQASGANWSVSVTGSTGSVAATIINSDGAGIDPRDRNWTVTETVPISAGATLDIKQVSGSVDSVNVLQVAGTATSVNAGAADAGTLRIVQASSSLESTITSTDAVATQDLPAKQVQVYGFNGATWDRIRTGGFDSGGALRTALAQDSIYSVYAQNPFGQGDSATALRVIHAGDATASVYAQNPSGQGDAATALRVIHAGDAIASVYAQNPFGQGDSATALRVIHAGDATASVYAQNPSGQGDAATALRVVVAGNSDVSVSATQVTSPWVTSVSGSIASVVATGPSAVGVVDDGTAPVQVAGISRQANPTAIAGGGVAKTSLDDLGRQLIRPVQVRDLIITAYASLTNGTETTLLAASVGAFHDLIYILGANNSDAAVTVDIRPVTAGNIVISLQVPANGTAGVSMAVPYPQSGSDTGNNWTADMPDITGTTVYLSALFSREV